MSDAWKKVFDEVTRMNKAELASSSLQRSVRRQCACGQGLQDWENECLDCTIERDKKFGTNNNKGTM